MFMNVHHTRRGAGKECFDLQALLALDLSLLLLLLLMLGHA
jgi:hypothetical protein